VRPELAHRLLPPASGAPEDNRGQRAISKALAEIKDLRQTVALLERELTDIRASMTSGDAREAVLAARVVALEASLKVALGRQEEPPKGAPSPQVAGFIEERARAQKEFRPGEPPRAAAVQAPGPRAGPPVGSAIAVQLASGPSVDAVRLSWQLLQESHKSTLRALEPRYLEGAGEPPSFRLLAGPIATIDEAERLCERLRLRRVTCSLVPFTGRPL
jgi:hypothetical protein